MCKRKPGACASPTTESSCMITVTIETGRCNSKAGIGFRCGTDLRPEVRLVQKKGGGSLRPPFWYVREGRD